VINLAEWKSWDEVLGWTRPQAVLFLLKLKMVVHHPDRNICHAG